MTDEEDDQPVEIGFLEEVEIHHDAEDVKTVRLIGSRGTADVEVTDDSMTLFLEAAETVFDRIHEDMNEVREIFRDYGRDLDEEDGGNE